MSGWFFSGLNCATDNIRIWSPFSSSLRSGNAVKCSTLHGGYIRCVFNGHFQIELIWSSVHDEFTIIISAQRPTHPYNWNTLLLNTIVSIYNFFFIKRSGCLYLHMRIIYNKESLPSRKIKIWQLIYCRCAQQFFYGYVLSYQSK